MNNLPFAIVEAERMDGGVVITFTDGKCAFYSAALLRSAFDHAEDLEPLDE